MKHLTVLLLIISLCQSAIGRERKNPFYSAKDLSNPESIYYVPHPYATSRQKILANLEAQVKIKYRKRLERKKELKKRHPERNYPNRPVKKDILYRLLVEKKPSRLKIGRIITVKNRSYISEKDYSYAIFIMRGEKVIELAILMDASGVLKFRQSILKTSRDLATRVLYEKESILAMLCHQIGKKISLKDVKSMDRYSASLYLGQWWAPIWEIVLDNNQIYYYSTRNDFFYVIKEIIPWEKDEYGNFKSVIEVAPFDRSLTDGVNEKIIVLKRI
jgi:hypothetical protein